jgi:hypothetical protein
MEEAEIVRGATIIPGAEATHGVEPGEVALDHPAVSAKPFRRLDAAPRNAMAYAPCAAGVSALPVVVAFVSMRFVRPVAGATATGPFEQRDRIEQGFEELRVMHVRPRQEDRERNALGVDHKMALAPRSALIRRVRAENVAPLFAATVELSRAARVQSISPAQLSSWSNSACNCFHTPRRVQLRKRRQHVEPLPQPISNGSNCHGSAVFSTNRIPVSTCRLDTRGRPPFLPGLRSGGNSGSIRIQSSSVTRGFMPHKTTVE